MAELMKCEVCGHDISSDAARCPNCGHPVKPPMPTRLLAYCRMAVGEATSRLKSFWHREKVVRFRRRLANFSVFSFKMICVVFLNGLIIRTIEEILKDARFSIESYLTYSIVSTVVLPFSFGALTLATINRHYGKRARRCVGLLFMLLMVLGSFGPLANVGFVSKVIPYYIVRITMLVIFGFLV